MSTTNDKIDELVVATTNLLTEVAGQKDRLVTASNTAETKANESKISAQSSQSNALTATSKSAEAAASAQKAKSEADRASQIAGLDTVDQAVTKQAPSITNAVIEALSGGMIKNRQDAAGNWSMFFVLPKFTNEMVNNALGTNWTPASDVHPCFIRPNGSIMESYEVAVYLASNDGKGNPVSKAHSDPYTSVNFDVAKAKCEGMGGNFHLLSNSGWAALAIYALANQYQPTGNTYYGRSHSKQMQAGIRHDSGLPGDVSGTARTLTGSGPVAWRLLNDMFSPADMVGNVWEWVDGLKLDNGRIFVATTNDSDEMNWVAQDAFLDTGNKLNSQKTASASTNITWGQAAKDPSYVANQLLQQLLIEPITETASIEGRLYYNNDDVRLPLRGGLWYSGSYAGLAALGINDPRPYAGSNVGFRPAYFE